MVYSLEIYKTICVIRYKPCYSPKTTRHYIRILYKMSSWKQYGGTNKFDSLNNIIVNNVIADTITLRKAYYGTFDISGVLRVGSEAYVGTTTFTRDLVASNDISGRTLHISGDSYFSGNLNLLNDQYIKFGKLFINNDFDACGNARVKKSFSLGDSGLYLNADNTRGNIGVNKMNAIALLDLSGTQETMLHVFSDASKSRSVITQTREKQGIAFETDGSGTRIRIHGETGVGTNNREDAIIEYIEGGVLAIDVSNQTNFLSKVAISNREETKIVGTIYNENLIICSDVGEPHLPDVYLDPASASSTVSLVNTDENSMVYMNLLSNTGGVEGMRIGGGSYSNDPTRTIGTIGHVKGEIYTPTMNIVSGNSNLSKKSTIGINTHAPQTEKYTVDINGPVSLHNGEISVSKTAGFQIKDMHMRRSNMNSFFAVGTPYLIEFDDEGFLKYRQKIIYTNDGGETWLENFSLRDDTIESQPINLNAVYVVDNSLAFVGGDSGYLYYTNNGGLNFYPIADMDADTILSIYVFRPSSPSAPFRVFIGRQSTIFWFDVLPSIYTDNNGVSSVDVNYGVIVLNNISSLEHMDGIGSVFYVVGNTYIEKYTILQTGGVITNTVFNSVLNTNVENKTMHRVCIYNANLLLIVGNGLIMKTMNAGTSWTSIAIDLNVKSGFLFSTTYYVFTGEKVGGNAIYFSRDGTTIETVNNTIINNSGNANMLLSSLSINRCFIKDIDNIIVSAYKNMGSKIYNLFLPEIFNARQNRVLDISGVLTLTGDFEIGGGGKFVSRESDVYLFDENNVSVHIGDENSSAYFGGNLEVSKKLGIVGDVSMISNVYSAGYMEANRVGILTDLSLNAMSRLYIHGRTDIDGSLNTVGDVSMVRANIGTATLGNVNIENDLYVEGKIVVPDLSVNRAVIRGLSGETIDASNMYLKGNLVSHGVLKSDYIDSVETGGDLFIGCLGLTEGSSKNIFIGSDGTNTQATTNTIRIGGPKDNIVITGQNTSVNIENINAGPIIYLNKLDASNDVVNMGINTSAGAGIHIVDNSNNDAGKIVVSSNMEGYILKAPASVTKMRMDIGTMGSGILSLKPDEGLFADSSFVMRSFALEPENIMVRGNVVDGKQIVDISSGFIGVVSFGKTENIVNTAVDISGNVICSKLGVGTTSVNPDFALAVEGNVYASGYIWQF